MTKTWVPLFLVGIALLSGCVSKSDYEKLQADYTTLEQENDSLEAKIKALDARIFEQSSLLNDLKGKLGNVTTHKAELDRTLAETKQALSELAQRKAQMEAELRNFKDLTRGLQSMIDTGNVKISFIKGRMVVSLGSDVLFPSGSAKLSTEGRDAITLVTKQLVKIQTKDFQVEGHTDNVPIKTATFPSNWELASARALNVVNTMMTAGMPSSRISAASYSDTRPAATNDSAEKRAQNRRIDIVIVPDLSKLMDVDALARQTGSPSTPERQVSSEVPGESDE